MVPPDLPSDPRPIGPGPTDGKLLVETERGWVVWAVP